MKQIEPPALVTYARIMLDSGKVADADRFQRLTNAEGKKCIKKRIQQCSVAISQISEQHSPREILKANPPEQGGGSTVEQSDYED